MLSKKAIEQSLANELAFKAKLIRDIATASDAEALLSLDETNELRVQAGLEPLSAHIAIQAPETYVFFDPSNINAPPPEALKQAYVQHFNQVGLHTHGVEFNLKDSEQSTFSTFACVQTERLGEQAPSDWQSNFGTPFPFARPLTVGADCSQGIPTKATTETAQSRLFAGLNLFPNQSIDSRDFLAGHSDYLHFQIKQTPHEYVDREDIDEDKIPADPNRVGPIEFADASDLVFDEDAVRNLTLARDPMLFNEETEEAEATLDFYRRWENQYALTPAPEPLIENLQHHRCPVVTNPSAFPVLEAQLSALRPDQTNPLHGNVFFGYGYQGMKTLASLSAKATDVAEAILTESLWASDKELNQYAGLSDEEADRRCAEALLFKQPTSVAEIPFADILLPGDEDNENNKVVYPPHHGHYF